MPGPRLRPPTGCIMQRAMSIGRYLFLPVLIAVVGGGYLLLSGEMAGGAMLLAFAGAAALFSWVVVPTLDHEGTTAPVDPDFEDPGR